MSWLDARGISRIHQNVLPAIGFIIPGYAAVWLYQTDSDFCQIENIYSNPAAPEDKRKQVDLLINTSVIAARELGYKFLQCVSNHPSIIARAIKYGAKAEPMMTQLTLQLF